MLDVERALDELDAEGYARLGRVLSDEGVAALGGRADELMHDRAARDGLFFQHDSPTGRYQDLAFGRGWVGPGCHSDRR